MSPTRIARAERAFVARVLTTAVVAGALLGAGLATYAVAYLDIGGRQHEAAAQREAGCERGNVARAALRDLARGGIIAVRSRPDYSTDEQVRASELMFIEIIRGNPAVDCRGAIEGRNDE